MQPCISDDIDIMVGSNSKLQDPTNKIFERAGAYGKEINTE